MITLLSTTFFGPIEWYRRLYRAKDGVLIEAHESFRKQTYRNRCIIATAQGPQTLSVPVCHGDGATDIAAVRLSTHGNWQRSHWQAIASAYGDSPFFEYYEDDLRPLFTEALHYDTLLEYNEAIRRTICSLIDIQPTVAYTTRYATPNPADTLDLRDAITPKSRRAGVSPVKEGEYGRPHEGTQDGEAATKPYYQVFSQRTGFLPNLSILDLLCNMGPESIFLL